MTDTQPDFSALFFATFSSGHPLHYRIRTGPNFLHDLIFVSSLTHDARVLTPNIEPKESCIDLALNRDCWEMGLSKHDGISELHIADSTLSFTGVKSIRWHFDSPPADKPWLQSLWVDRDFSNAPVFDFQLHGTDWNSTITLIQDEWSITLVDSEAPYLNSSRNSR